MLSSFSLMIIASLSAIVLAFISVRNILFFPAAYFCIDMLFTKAGLNFEVGNFSLVTSKVFLSTFFVLFTCKQFKHHKHFFNKIYNELLQNRLLIIIPVVYLICNILVIIHSYFIFDIISWYELRTLFISSWGIMLGLLLPVSSLDFKKMVKYWGLTTISIIFIFAPQTFYYYFNTMSQSISRTYAIPADLDPFLRYFYFIPKSLSECSNHFCGWLFVDTFNKNVLSVGIFSIFSILFRYFFDVKNNFRSLLVLISVTMFVHYFLYVNSGFATISMLFYTFIIFILLYFYYVFYLKQIKFSNKIFTIIVLCFVIIIHTAWFDINKFVFPKIKSTISLDSNVSSKELSHNKILFYSHFASRFTIKGDYNDSNIFVEGRLAKIVSRITLLLEKYPITGFGPYGNSQVKKEKRAFYDAVTGHSSIVDCFIIYGVISGFLVSIQFFLPLLLLLTTRWRKFSFFDAYFWILYFTGTFLLSLFDKYGGITPHISIHTMMTLLFIRYRFYFSKKILS